MPPTELQERLLLGRMVLDLPSVRVSEGCSYSLLLLIGSWLYPDIILNSDSSALTNFLWEKQERVNTDERKHSCAQLPAQCTLLGPSSLCSPTRSDNGAQTLLGALRLQVDAGEVA